MRAAVAAECFPHFGCRPLFYSTVEQPSSNDELATGQTIALMSLYAVQDSRGPLIRAAVRQAVPSGATVEQAAAGIFDWIRRRIRFQQDEATLRAVLGDGVAAIASELLIRPVDLLAMPDPVGDCDEFSMLAASMLLAAGFQPRYVTIAADPEDDRYSHVFVIAGPAQFAVDASHGAYPGWEYRGRVSKRRVWPLTARQMQGIRAIDINWGSLIETGAKTAGEIFKKRYGNPPAGVYAQTGPNGETVYYRQQPGATALSFPGVGVTSGGSSILILVAIAAVVVLLMMSRGRR